ncbi:universal stress protein [Umezawaea sp. Da 62-37]|uniref:universal stress protein n=1 Tax=Umezawaea sp. Da 62-37 TaxID=3075927 RepID=UPI0028F71100|nr:universal stress protein [Umezawaea sp. Da 62-37]WNV87464.1 universal stress protein [Umezawaea sp. Da 62-37]
MEDLESRPIVVGVDGSPASRAALAWAVDEAERRGCAVEAVTGQHRDFGMAVGVVPIDMMIGMLPEELRAARQQVLDKAVAEITTEVEIRTVVAGEEAKLALTSASEHASLLVVGRRGLGAAMTALLGSVSAYCVRHASCPVVVINDLAEPMPERVPGVGVPMTPGPLL